MLGVSRRGRNAEPPRQRFLPRYPETTFFASGASRMPDIVGLTSLGFPFGVSAPECKQECVDAIKYLAWRGTMPVFADSGAVAERERINDRWVTKAPISDTEWHERLDLYSELATMLGVCDDCWGQDEPRLFVVAPDLLGSQSGTLKRLRKFRPRIEEIVRKGVYILVPLQPGPMSLEDFYAAAVRAIGGNLRTGHMPGSPMVAGAPTLIPAIPMRRQAGVQIADVERFMRVVKPRRLHLLGIGPGSARWPEVLGARARASPKTRLYHDAQIIRARAVEGSPFTQRQRRTMEVSPALAYLGHFPFGAAKFDDMWKMPSAYMTREDLKRFADVLKLDVKDRRAFYRDPEAFLETEGWFGVPEVQLLLGRFWDEDRKRKFGPYVRATTIIREFGNDPRAGQYEPVRWLEFWMGRFQPMEPGKVPRGTEVRRLKLRLT